MEYSKAMKEELIISPDWDYECDDESTQEFEISNRNFKVESEKYNDVTIEDNVKVQNIKTKPHGHADSVENTELNQLDLKENGTEISSKHVDFDNLQRTDIISEDGNNRFNRKTTHSDDSSENLSELMITDDSSENLSELKCDQVKTEHSKVITIPAMKKNSKKSRRYISLEDKLKILDRLKSGEKTIVIAKDLKLQAATIRAIRRNETKIRARISSGSLVSLNKTARIKDTLIPKMEKYLMLWIEDCFSRNFPLNTNVIQEKAIKIYRRVRALECVSFNELHQHEFKASKGWFNRFMNRFSLRNVKIVGESASVDIEAAQRFQEYFPKIVEDGNYTADQVYNATETALYWKKMPGRTYISKNEKSASGFRVSEDNITLLLCSNASGDNVIKPMLINRSLNPQAMKGVDKSTLPVFWRANRNACVTGVLFRDWFYNCFVPEVEDYLKRKNISFKALLLVDNAPRYTEDLNHPAVKLIFLPPDTTSILRPKDQGIIRLFKSLYVRHTFEHILENIDFNSSTTTVTDLWKDFSILNSIEIILLSLKELKCSNLNACWGKLWPEVVIREDCLTSVTTEVNRIIDISHTLGGEGFVDMNEEDVIELINTGNQRLDKEQLMQLAESSKSSGEENSLQNYCEPEQHFNLEKLNEGLELAKSLEEHFTNNDPSTKRSEKFKRKLKECLAPYHELKERLESNNNKLLKT
ncbi:tigger transposable element-derived protein 1-like isoform X1 [Centruroides sculpturatus]|uniref:tigger transposable element-derived protein 1-like isoform X1 n=1 Tax=Centruroides sculpturatus TaxID=218467 RepID=UPI000C6DADC9|nr:tigger transposable element-derived protein 1-like isoform X1 [Centruroides sculpturatus]